MDLETLDACVKIAACICGKDGILAEAELDEMFTIIKSNNNEYERKAFEESIDAFFDSNKQIEDYLALVRDPADKKFILHVAEASASIDGLDPLENIALQKAMAFWGEH